MAKGKSDSELVAARVWDTIDSTVINVIGGRVYYNHPELGKCFARVTGTIEERNEQGQIQNWLRVYPNNGGEPFNVKAALSSDRAAGTFALATDGDLRN
jgi:hypothetical protein